MMELILFLAVPIIVARIVCLPLLLFPRIVYNVGCLLVMLGCYLYLFWPLVVLLTPLLVLTRWDRLREERRAQDPYRLPERIC